MDAKDMRKGRLKFEQDIKIPFVKLFSYSAKQPITCSKKLNKLNDPARLFPGLAPALDQYEKSAPLVLVNGFAARELVITGAFINTDTTQDSTLECALIVWYNAGTEHQMPLLVEFSYRYSNKKEKYSGELSHKAFTVFQLAQSLESWTDPVFGSKTNFVYSLGNR